MREPDFYTDIHDREDELQEVAIWIEGVDPGCPGSDVEPYTPPQLEITVDADYISQYDWESIYDQAEEHHIRELENARDMAADNKLEAMRDEQ